MGTTGKAAVTEADGVMGLSQGAWHNRRCAARMTRSQGPKSQSNPDDQFPSPRRIFQDLPLFFLDVLVLGLGASLGFGAFGFGHSSGGAAERVTHPFLRSQFEFSLHGANKYYTPLPIMLKGEACGAVEPTTFSPSG
jgi:hypothetical protein